MRWPSPLLRALPQSSLLLPLLPLPRSVGVSNTPNLATAPKPATIVEEKPKPAETKPSSDYYTEFVTKFVDPAVKCSNELGEQFTALVEIATLDPA